MAITFCWILFLGIAFENLQERTEINSGCWFFEYHLVLFSLRVFKTKIFVVEGDQMT